MERNILKISGKNYIIFCYGYEDEWIYKSSHPSEFILEYLVRYKEIEIVKEKFNTIEKIEQFKNKNVEHYNKMVELYEQETKYYKEVIY